MSTLTTVKIPAGYAQDLYTVKIGIIFNDEFININLMKTQTTLQTIKAIHTIAWAFFAGCVLAIPIYARISNFKIATILCAVVFVEVLILVVNNWKCPLTPIAARYTESRQDNFDIYLPIWIARYNKEIFGSLYLFGIIYTLARWQGWLG